MGKQQELIIQKVAPRAGIAVAQLHKIDRAVKLSPASNRLYFPDARVDLHKGTRAQQRIQRVILQADIAILAVPDIEMLDQGYRHFSPEFDNAREKVGVVQVEGSVKSNGKRNRTVRVIDFERRQVRVRQRGSQLVEPQLLKVQLIELQHVGKLHPINGAQAVQLEYTGHGVGILDLRKPRVGDLKFRIALGFRDALAEFRHVARSYA